MAFATAFACSAIATPANAADESLRRNVSWQMALARTGFSPGVIDGKIGAKTELATREFQRVRGLKTTGALDAATIQLLGVNEEVATIPYTVVAADFHEIGPAPTDWNERAKLSRLGYESIETALAEKFQCSRGLLAALNPGRSIKDLKPGDTIHVPNLGDLPPLSPVTSLHVDLSQKVIRALDREQRLVALFHCSIAADKSRRPRGETHVEVVAENPDYLFDPKMWPEVKNVERKLRIPPGPRNPVGRCWIGLALPGYGIHGTPNPELIGKTGSHGCFRLANWDAVRLGKAIRPGAVVKFFSAEGAAVASR